MPQASEHLTRMLIVDDELGICDFLRSFFSRRGYEVRIACSGEEALQVAEQFQPRVMLLDIRMPGMSGLEVLERLHATDPDCKIIMTTAVMEESLMERARRLGASDYITKPFSLDYLERDVLSKLAGL